MPVIGCTQKLLKELNVKPVGETKSVLLAGWHANLLRIDRRKCVLFTHDATLYSVFVPGMRKSEFQRFTHVFQQNLFRALNVEGLPQDQISEMLKKYQELEIGKTNNRSVLGSMNDLAYQIKYWIKAEGGLLMIDMVELNKKINRIPMSAIEMIYAIDQLKLEFGS